MVGYEREWYKAVSVCVGYVENRNKLRLKRKVADPKYIGVSQRRKEKKDY